MKPIYKNILLGVVVLAVVIAIFYLEVIKPSHGPATTALEGAQNDTSTVVTDTGSTSSTVQSSSTTAITGTSTVSGSQYLASRASVIAQEKKQYQAAPEITDPSGFVNTGPFKLADLIGKKVVLLDFWTYSCINCVRTIPYLNAWYQKYKDAGLVIVGIHTPEFQFEHDHSNVQTAVQNLGIQYPVVQDNNMGTWDAYQNLYWPHEFLINIDGFIVYDHVGEGNYNETETHIQSALAERDQALKIATTNVPTGMANPSGTISINFEGIQSPETYFGAARNGYLANGPAMTNGTYALTTPDSFNLNALYLGGTWNFSDQYAENTTADAMITYKYNSKNVYFVAAGDGKPVTLQVLVDGKAPGVVAGSDVSASGVLTVWANRLYNVISDPAGYGEHTLQIMVKQPDLQAYTFTFG